VGEAAAMEFRNIDFVRTEVRIAQHLHWERHKDGKIILVPGTKTGPTRSIPLTATCVAMLKRRKLTATSTKVFEGTSPEVGSITDLSKLFTIKPSKSWIWFIVERTLCDILRGEILDETKDIYACREFLGHTDLKVTQVYAKYSNESVRKSFQLFQGWLGCKRGGPRSNARSKVLDQKKSLTFL